ncbi:MAG: hypothetical protein EXS55_02995 [Candidatus Magasanikbacteria bacterium]|nr:hypothetical protein [Candidatus Magasanikbacteria bacterium]
MKLKDLLDSYGIPRCPDCGSAGGTHPNGAGFLEDMVHMCAEGWCTNCAVEHTHAWYKCGVCNATSCRECGAKGKLASHGTTHPLEIHISWKACWCKERHEESFDVCFNCRVLN